MKNSKIEWTEATWNPLRGCSRVSEGCRFCYAEKVAERWSRAGEPYEGLVIPSKKGSGGHPRWTGEVRIIDYKLNEPLKWKKPKRIFVNSMSDLFHEKVPVDYILKVFDVMRRADWHQFQVLTKRSRRLLKLNAFIDWPDNVWMGVSVEDDRVTDRIAHLRRTDAKIRFLSLEPLIGPIPKINLDNIHWVIIGGESGPHARIMEPEWAKELLNQCKTANVPCFMKQMGTRWAGGRGKGNDINTFPEALQVREYPKVPRDNVARLVLQEGKLVEERGEGLLQEPVVMEDKPLAPNDPPKPLPKWLHEPKTRKQDRE